MQMGRTRLAVAAALVTPAVAAAALTLTPRAQAANGDPILAGQLAFETNPTLVTNTSANSGLALEGFVTGTTSTGVRGAASGNDSVGVAGSATGTGRTIGISGTGATGISGVGTHFGVLGSSGCTPPPCGVGVFGVNTGTGVGLAGFSANGTGVGASSKNGTALAVSGKATFNRSGVVTLPKGTSKKTVSMAGVTAASMVLATAQQNTSVSVKAAVPAAGSFKIVLTGKAPPGGLKVAYFVLN